MTPIFLPSSSTHDILPAMRSSGSRQGAFSALQWLSVIFIIAAIILTTFQVASFSRIYANFPVNMSIAGVPVGGMDRQDAADRLLEAYSTPVELHYSDNDIQLIPSTVGFELDLTSMLAAADLVRIETPFWNAFWYYLWGLPSEPSEIPLRADYSEERLRTFLEDEIAPRYDIPAIPSRPIPGTVDWQPGELGTSINIDQTFLPVEKALKSINQRNVTIPLKNELPSKPSFNNLEILLKQTIELSGFDGVVGFYFRNLGNEQEIHFAYKEGTEVSVNPDIAFSAASIIKIPILVSVYKHLDGEPDAETTNLIEKMIIESGNESADWLMDRVIDANRAPLVITSELQALGLQNTFLAGHFYIGAPLLDNIETPANQREDIDTDPDVYNQTTPSDIGMLLVDIYQCADVSGGSLLAVFPEEFNSDECKMMINYLKSNKMPSLLEAGIPDGTQIAHKHGWVSDEGIINLIGDAGIIYTPGANYVLAIFFQHPVQILWDPASTLMADLSKAVYNFYNPPTQ